jgi:nucleotidyltransferase substrate binding protein (TIGR01987 family)
MDQKELRWHQRLNSFSKAMVSLNNAVRLSKQRQLSELERQGLIQSFEFSHELAWKVMKDYFNHQGNQNIHGSRDATREAFKFGLIDKGEIWMDMIANRNRTSHTYDEQTAKEIEKLIINRYADQFNQFQKKMAEIKAKDR